VLLRLYTITVRARQLTLRGVRQWRNFGHATGDLDPNQYMVPWSNPSQPCKWHLDRFRFFEGSYERDQQL